MKHVIMNEIKRALRLLAGKLEGFYLAGGTALSLFYFHHRESYDLDLFSRDFSRIKVERIVSGLSRAMKAPMRLIGEQNRKDRARMLVYNLEIDKRHSLKVDFIEDFYELISPLQKINGIPVLSKEDIYFKKILAVSGGAETADLIGRKRFTGGRQDVKDLFDLYFLSRTFMPLSKFVFDYCAEPQREGIVIWYSTFDREAMKLALNDVRTDKKVPFQEMERHFRSEVERLIRQEL